MHWQEIAGWFQWRSGQEEAVHRFPENSCFIEVGTYLGRSLCSLGEVVEQSPLGRHQSPAKGKIQPFFWMHLRMLVGVFRWVSCCHRGGLPPLNPLAGASVLSDSDT